MKKFDLIDIDEKNLPDVNLSDDQKADIKGRIELRLNTFLKNNPKLDIDASTDNIYKIEKKLGNKKHSIVHMVAHANVLRELVTEAIDKDCPLPPDEILYKKTLRKGAGKEFRDIASMWTDDPFYYQLYITKDTLLIYTLDYRLKLIDTRYLKISDIESIAVTNVPYTDYWSTKLSNTNLVLCTKETIFPYPKIYYFIDDDPKDLKSLKEIEVLLYSLGVKKFIPKKSTKVVLGINIFFILLLIITICSILFYSF